MSVKYNVFSIIKKHECNEETIFRSKLNEEVHSLSNLLNIMIYIYFIFSQLYLIYSCGMGMVSFFSGSLQYHKRLNIYRDETVKQKFSNMEDSAI